MTATAATPTAHAEPFTREGWQLFALMGVIWGVPYLFIKVAVEHLSPPVVVFGRTAIACLPLLWLGGRAGAIRPALRRWRPVLTFAGLEMALPWLLLTDAEQDLPSGLTGLLIACVPIVGAVAAFVLGDRSALHPLRLAGIGAGLAGVALLVATDLRGGDNGPAPWWSIVEVLIVCVCYATAPFILTRKLADVPDLGIVAVALTAVAVLYIPFALLARPDVVPPLKVWGAVAGLGVLCTAVAFIFFFRLIASVGPARATLITFVNPAVAVIVGALVLDERITVTTLAGFTLVIAGCTLATRTRRARIL